MCRRYQHDQGLLTISRYTKIAAVICAVYIGLHVILTGLEMVENKVCEYNVYYNLSNNEVVI